MSTNRGFTLLEILIAIALLGLAASALLLTTQASLAQQVENANRITSIGLATQLMEEICSKRFAEDLYSIHPLGPDAGESDRNSFDDVDDYHLFFKHITTPTSHSLITQAHTNWYYRVNVGYRDEDSLAPTQKPSQLLAVEVEVLDQNQKQLTQQQRIIGLKSLPIKLKQ